MTRPYCEACQFPSRTCICDLVKSCNKVEYNGQIHVIQHPDEARHAKNSVQLVKQLMPEVYIWQGETPNALENLKEQVEAQRDQWACFFPTADSQLCTANEPERPASHLLFIDATWRKARKIWYLNPWLHTVPLYHLPDDLEGGYKIRKNHASHQLSTLEAIAYAIASHGNSEGLLQLFATYQERMQKFTL